MLQCQCLQYAVTTSAVTTAYTAGVLEYDLQEWLQNSYFYFVKARQRV